MADLTARLHSWRQEAMKRMPKRVILVGHCGPDSTYLRIAVTAAAKEVSVVSADDDATLKRLIAGGADLLLVNRQLDYGFTAYEGVKLIEDLRLKNPDLRMMLISNFPEAQQAAIQAGALPGFGKSDIGRPRAKEILRTALAGDDQ